MTDRPKSESRAKQIAREAMLACEEVGTMTECAEYAVNLALEAACTSKCKRCRNGVPLNAAGGHLNSSGRVIKCDAAAIRAMMEEK